MTTPNYKDNPNLPLQIVKTISGNKEYRKNCRKRGGSFYAIGTDIIKINGVWYAIRSKKVNYDYELKEWYLTDLPRKNMVHRGVVGIKEGGFVLGSFTKNKYNNCNISNQINTFQCIHPDVLIGSGYVEEIGTGYYKKGLVANAIVNSRGHSDKGYNIEDNGYHELIELYNNKPYKINLNHAKIANLLKDTTFGVEMEACAGNMPPHLLFRTGTCICKDGSILDLQGRYAPEYVTVPLSGAKGISNVVELCNYLKERNNLDLKCSLHLHLGGFKTSRLFLLALHSLCYKIQGGVFKMFPYYKLKPEGIKGKNYCKVLPKVIKRYEPEMNFEQYISENYKKLYTYLSEDDRNGKCEPCKEYNRKNMKHKGMHKWNKVSRYHWLNMINSIFSTRNTLEFRIHTPTFNETKIINWLLICNAICKYAERYPLRCLDATKLDFDNILEYYQLTNSQSIYAQFITNYLKAYVESRVEMFKEDKKKEDHTSEHELIADKTYTFTYQDKQLL